MFVKKKYEATGASKIIVVTTAKDAEKNVCYIADATKEVMAKVKANPDYISATASADPAQGIFITLTGNSGDFTLEIARWDAVVRNCNAEYKRLEKEAANGDDDTVEMELTAIGHSHDVSVEELADIESASEFFDYVLKDIGDDYTIHNAGYAIAAYKDGKVVGGCLKVKPFKG